MRGHLDHQEATWQHMIFTGCDGVYGLEGHAVQGGHVEHRCGDDLEDALAHFTVAAGFKKTPVFQLRASSRAKARQARASGSPQN